MEDPCGVNRGSIRRMNPFWFSKDRWVCPISSWCPGSMGCALDSMARIEAGSYHGKLGTRKHLSRYCLEEGTEILSCLPFTFHWACHLTVMGGGYMLHPLPPVATFPTINPPSSCMDPSIHEAIDVQKCLCMPAWTPLHISRMNLAQM